MLGDKLEAEKELAEDLKRQLESRGEVECRLTEALQQNAELDESVREAAAVQAATVSLGECG